MKKKIKKGSFFKDFDGFDLTKSGKSIKCYRFGVPGYQLFRVKNPGTENAFFYIQKDSFLVIRYDIGLYIGTQGRGGECLIKS